MLYFTQTIILHAILREQMQFKRERQVHKMKIKERFKLFNYARRDYSKIFSMNYEFKEISYDKLVNLLKASRHSAFCEHWYCCHGLYHNCWQDPFEEGIWGFSQEDVNVLLAGVLKRCRKYIRNKYRVLYCEKDGCIEVVLIMRDVFRCDYLITFTDNDYCNIV